MFFLLFFSMSMKEATVYSVAVIFFSQLSKLVTYVATATVPKFDYRILLIAAPAAVIAGIIGAALNKKRPTTRSSPGYFPRCWAYLSA